MAIKNIKLYDLQYFLFALGLFFFPFNNFEGINVLGEFRNEAGAFFFLAGIFSLVFNRKLYIPYKNIFFQLMMIFVVWAFIATLINWSTVSENYFKFTSGINRFIKQYISLLISFVGFFLFFLNIIYKMSASEILYKIRKIFLISLLVVSIYGFFETLIAVFGVYTLLPVLDAFSYFPFTNLYIHDGRIASVTFEPPFLAIYLISICSWMFSYILTSKNIARYIPTLLILVLTYFSGSRTALIIISLQFVVFSSFLIRTSHNRKSIIQFFKFAIIGLIILLIFNSEKIVKSVDEKLESLNFTENLKSNISNQSRFGMQYAALVVFSQHPIAGVGYGQQTYHSRFHYPKWATKNNYEFELFYQNSHEPSFPPAYNLYTRLLAEVGIVGIIIIVFLFYTLLKSCLKLLKKEKNGDRKTLIIIIFVGFIGFFINWMQFDAFRVYSFWLALAILINLIDTKNKHLDEKNSAHNTTLQ